MLNKPKAKRKVGRHRNVALDGKRNLIGARLRELRRKMRPKVTQEDLAGRLAAMSVTLDRTAIYRIELGRRSVSDIELSALAKALRAPISALFPKDH